MKLFKKRIITRGDNEEYLIRWTLFTCKWFSIKIHKIILSDDDCLHDHPWAFISIILWRGYVEHSVKTPHTHYWTWRPGTETPVKQYYWPGCILFRPAQFKHRLQVNKPATTLVITFKKVRLWGFWTSKGFTPWFDYKQSGAKCD